MSTPLASLTTAIRAKVEAMVAPASRVELTNQRNPAASTQDDARMQSACETAAVDVQASLGDDVGGTDLRAVSIGARLAILDLQGMWSLTLGDKPVTTRDRVMAELNHERMRRIAALDFELADPPEGAFDKINARYGTRWEEA